VAGPTAVPTAIEKLMPIAPQLELFDRDVTVAPGIDAVHSPGHTPGSTVYVLSSGSRRAILLGDVAHSVVVFAPINARKACLAVVAELHRPASIGLGGLVEN
jgi:glyoxylase-like metal-dependent hydrolase (beta-lactamase superfamily II)